MSLNWWLFSDQILKINDIPERPQAVGSILLSTDHPSTVSSIIDRFSDVVHKRPWVVHWPSIDLPLMVSGLTPVGVKGQFSPLSSTSGPWSMPWWSWISTDHPFIGLWMVSRCSWLIHRCPQEKINQWSLSTAHSGHSNKQLYFVPSPFNSQWFSLGKIHMNDKNNVWHQMQKKNIWYASWTKYPIISSILGKD